MYSCDISTAFQSELDVILVDPHVRVVRSIDLGILPIGAIVRLRTRHHWKYLLLIAEFNGKRVVYVVLSDRTGSVGNAKYRGAYVIDPTYMVLTVGEQFKYGKILTAALTEIGLFS